MRAYLAASVLSLATVLAPATATPSEGSAHARGFLVQLIDEDGSLLPTFENGGRTYVLGAKGHRYSVRVRNQTGRRVEFVAAVDGRDVLDGKPSAWDKRGYIVDPYGQVTIDGFRLDSDSVAAFRFSSVSRSYAAQMGDARDVGVIGVAVFAERVYVPPPHVYEGPAMPPAKAERALGAGGAAADMDSMAAPSPAAPEAQASSAPASATKGMSRMSARPGLGTEFGEQRDSRTYATQFERASSRPEAILSLRYDDRRGLQAMGIDLDDGTNVCDVDLRETAQPFRRNAFSTPPQGWNGR